MNQQNIKVIFSFLPENTCTWYNVNYNTLFVLKKGIVIYDKLDYIYIKKNVTYKHFKLKVPYCQHENITCMYNQNEIVIVIKFVEIKNFFFILFEKAPQMPCTEIQCTFYEIFK